MRVARGRNEKFKIETEREKDGQADVNDVNSRAVTFARPL